MPYDPLTGFTPLAPPDRFGKSAKETKTDFYMKSYYDALQAGAQEANRLTNLETSQGQKAEDLLRASGQKANVPTISRNDMNLKFGRGADTSGDAFTQALSQIRTMLGENGMSGGSGWAAGLAADADAQRLNSLLGTRRDIFIEKSTTDALDRLAVYGRDKDLAAQMMRPVAMQNSDFMNAIIGLSAGQLQGQQTLNAASKAADAERDAGWLKFAGGLGGAAIGAFA